MSLTSFIENDAELRRYLRSHFPKPNDSRRYPTIAPPLSANYQTVGTAFDYLLRWKLEHTNEPVCTAGRWIAEQSALLLAGYPELHGPASQAVSHARRRVAKYVQSGRSTTSLFVAALKVAQLDPVFRSGLPPSRPVIEPAAEDVEDLRVLYTAVPQGWLRAERRCVLNPTFAAGALVGGADADVVLDDILVDVKVTKDPKIWRAYFNQLLGYYLLYRIGGFYGLPKRPSVRRLGIYMARQATLYEWRVRDIASMPEFEKAASWFERRARPRRERFTG